MKIAVLLSGGVDSSVALRLLHDQGHELHAFYLKIWLEDEMASLGSSCPWQEDMTYVEAVCAGLGVPLNVVPLQREYYDTVVAYTIAEVRAGRTPNPDVFCNAYIKFGLFLQHIDDSFAYVATGHYAHVIHTQHGSILMATPDPIKDQTYFLAYLTQEQLKRALFPLGTLTKQHVRALAHDFNLPTKDRKDSQGICFLGKLKFNDFLRHYLGERPGELIDYESGSLLGSHKGFWFHTIGQRQGSGLPHGPWYVVAKDPAENKVFVSRTYYAQDKIRDTIAIESIRWIPDAPTVEQCTSGTMRVKLRHGPHTHLCMVMPTGSNRATIKLIDSRDQGIAPGQFAVLYDGARCVGAGIISLL